MSVKTQFGQIKDYFSPFRVQLLNMSLKLQMLLIVGEDIMPRGSDSDV